MSSLWVWHSVVVNKSNRPVLLEGEHNVYVQDSVGLYQGKAKIRRFQDGRVYLTNKRVIFLDSVRPDRAIAVDLRLVSAAEYVEGFLRSSPKVKAFLRQDAPAGGAPPPQMPPPSAPETVSWTCVICSYNNAVAADVDFDQLPKCGSCGIPPSPETVHAALDTASDASSASAPANSESCPKCTFINHPSMKYCELCGTPLRRVSSAVMRQIRESEAAAPDAPAGAAAEAAAAASALAQNPLQLQLEDKEAYANNTPYVKFSFRKGGDTQFLELLKGEIEKHKWAALVSRGGVNDNATRVVAAKPAPVRSRGIQGLEKFGELQRQQNEHVLSQSLADLEQLMHKAQDLLQLTSSFGTLVQKRPPAKAALSPLSVGKTSSLYHAELARHICEFLLTVELTKNTSMITTHDLFAAYNRFTVVSQGFGAELVSAADLEKSFRFFDTLKLPVALKTYQSGLRVVTQRFGSCSDAAAAAGGPKDLHQAIFEYLLAEEAHFLHQKFTTELLADTDGYIKSKYRYFSGRTVAEVAEHFGWSVSICIEELHQCIDRGLVVWDKHISGTFYFINKFDGTLAQRLEDEAVLREKAHAEVLSQQQQISTELKTQHATSQNLLSFDDFGFGMREQRGSKTPVSSTSQTLDELKGLTF